MTLRRFSHLLRQFAVSALVTLVVLIGLCVSANANGAAPRADYAFAQQKVYGMRLLLDATGTSAATLSGDPFGVTTKTAAVYSAHPGTSAFNGGLDAQQSFSGSGAPSAPVENFSGNVPAGFSVPDRERVLLQANPTPWATAKAAVTTAPTLPDFPAAHNFARADVYATPNPDITIAPSGSGTPPAAGPGGAYPANGENVPAGNLFSINPGTLSMDSAAEALLTDSGDGTFATGISEWVVLGGFELSGGVGQVSLNFSLVERLIAFASGPGRGVVTAANSLSWDVKDINNNSVWGALGQNPSTTRILPRPNNGFLGETYNNNTLIESDMYPGPNVVTFQTPVLQPGEYTFVITGKSSVDVNAVPEPATGAMIGLAFAALGGVAARRRRRGLAGSTG